MREPFLLALARMTLALAWAAVGLVALLGSVPENVAGVGHRARLNLVAVLPEGWAFFTRDPREALTEVYRRDSAHWQPVALQNAARENGFGFRRNSRLALLELGRLLESTRADQWRACGERIGDCLGKIEAIEVRIQSRPRWIPALCGDIVVRAVEPLPWAWSQHTDRSELPSKILPLRVEC